MALSTTEAHDRDCAIEMRKRILARNNLLDFARYVVPGYETPPHIKRIAEKLEAVERGDIKRLMVFMPPQHGKSMLISQIFPCWVLGRNPEGRIALASYAKDLALYQSRRARDNFVSEEMRVLFPDVHHRPETPGQRMIPLERQAAQEWGTTLGGNFYAVGVGGGLTGKPIDAVGIIDDPLRDMEQAESETIREKVWDWYQAVFRNRVHTTAGIVIVTTRWHPDDLVGRLLEHQESGEGDTWEVLSLPAISKNGGALWPEKWPLAYMEQTRRSLSTRVWAALFQQEPFVSGGNRFRIDGVKIHESLDDFPDTEYVRFWDLAFTEKQRGKTDPDYTAGSLLGIVKASENGGVVNHIWIKDIRRGQWETPQRDRVIFGTADSDGPAIQVLCESVGGQKGAVDALRAALQGKRICRGINVSTDKVTRAAPMEAPFEAGNVHLLRGDWNEAFLREFREFPAGKHDDIVDACSGAYNELNTDIPCGSFSAMGVGR